METKERKKLMKQIVGMGVFAVIGLLLVLSTVMAVPPVLQLTQDTGQLIIGYPKAEARPLNMPFALHFHLFNSSGWAVPPTQANCTIHIYNSTNGHKHTQNLSIDPDNIDMYATVPAGVYDVEGFYTYIVWCWSIKDNEAGFLSTYFYMTDDAQQFNQDAIFGRNGGWELPVVVLLALLFTIILYVGLNWEFNLLDAQNFQAVSAMKGFVMILLLWLGMWLIQFMTEIAEGNGAPADISTLLLAVYRVDFWMNWVITIYMVVFMLYNLLLYLQAVHKR